MAWYDPGAGAGVWANAIINPSLKNIIAQMCYAVNEREVAIARNRIAITSITRSSTTATVTTTTAHGITDQYTVFIRGANQPNYNGVQTATVTGTTTFTFPVDGATATPATGTMHVYSVSRFTYNANGNRKAYPAASDFVGMPISETTPPIAMVIGKNLGTITSITRSVNTATVTTTAAHRLTTGDQVEISGVTQSDYNGAYTATVTGSTTFTYTVANSPATPATGTAVILQSGITRSGDVATVRCIGHGLLTGNYVNIASATQSEYNGWQIVTANGSVPSVSSITRSGSTATATTSGAHGLAISDIVSVDGAAQSQYNGLKTVLTVPSSTTFTYSVSGSPATPATGTPSVTDLSRFTFTVSGTPLSPGTGAATATPHRHMIYFAQHDGTNGEFYSKAHDFAVNDRLSIYQHGGSGYTEWEVDGLVNAISGEKFEIVMAAPSPTDEIVTNHLYATKNRGLIVTLRELQVAIESLATASGTAKFVVDSAPYETAYTITSLLTAGSHGSTWLGLPRLSRGDLANVLLQMREALDLLTTVRRTYSITSKSADVKERLWTSFSKGLYHAGSPYTDSDEAFLDADGAGGAVVAVVGDWIEIVQADDDASYEGVWQVTYRGAISGLSFTDAVVFNVGFPPGEAFQNSQGINNADLEQVWDYAVADTSAATSSDTVAKREATRAGGAYQVTLIPSAEVTYTIDEKGPGTYVTGHVALLEYNNEDVTQDSFDVTDSDADVLTLDDAIGTNAASKTITKPDAFFDAGAQVLSFTSPEPGAHPFSTAMSSSVIQTTQRRLDVVSSNGAVVIRELVPGTHLTYG